VSGAGQPALIDPLEPILEAEELREKGLEACLAGSPVVLELGFGGGELLLDLAARHPEGGFLGIEVSRKRVHKTARRVARAGLRNVRLIHAPAEYVLERALRPGSLEACWINFSDPWPKKRHHKRRLIRPELVPLLARALSPGGALHVATDHAGYRDRIAEVMGAAREFENLYAPDAWSERRPERIETRYEADFVAEGRAIAYFAYRRR
jgi:tRNA (guanine-N7-)-methyltransferase